MPIDLNHSLNTVSEQVFGNSLLANIFGNVLSTALILAIIAVILIMFIYPAKPGTSFVVVVKIFIYMFGAAAALIFLHDGIRNKRAALQANRDEQLDLITQTNPADRDMIYSQEAQEVRPALSSSAPVVQQITIQAPGPTAAPANPPANASTSLPKYTSDRITGGTTNSYAAMNRRVVATGGNPYA